ncbi:MAG: acetamidase/formamidase family protein [Gaiellaceae bacterium]
MYSTAPPRASGGNIDCRELVPGTRLFLPIAVDGARFSAGDCHARQADGEVSQVAIECPLEHGELTLTVREAPALATPVAWTPIAWLTFGFDEDLDEAAATAIEAMLELMGREHGLARADALALASLVVDLHVTGRQRHQRRPCEAAARRDPLHDNHLRWLTRSSFPTSARA